MAKELGIFIGKYSKFSLANLALLAGKAGNYSSIFISDPRQISSRLNGVMVIGGDGTTQLVVDTYFKKKLSMPLLVVAGGTNNTFYRSLLSAGAYVSIDTIHDHLADGSGFRNFHPGFFGDFPFITDLGMGQSEPDIGQWNELLRTYLNANPARPTLAAFASWIGMLGKSENDISPFNMSTISPFFSRRRAFRNQSLFDEYITNVSIESHSKPETMIKLLWSYFCLGMGHPQLAKPVLQIKQKKTYEPSHLVQKIWVSGETRKIPPTQAKIERTAISIPVAAVIFKRR